MRRKRCEDCKQLKEDVKITNCPYAEDVHNDPNVKIQVCDDCYKERVMDI